MKALKVTRVRPTITERTTATDTGFAQLTQRVTVTLATLEILATSVQSVTVVLIVMSMSV